MPRLLPAVRYFVKLLQVMYVFEQPRPSTDSAESVTGPTMVGSWTNRGSPHRCGGLQLVLMLQPSGVTDT